jgi:hypothetical protein
VDVVADLPAHPQAAEPVQQRDALLHHPTVDAQSGAVLGAAAREPGLDVLGSDLVAVGVVVVGPIGVQLVWPAAWSAAFAPDRGDGVDQRDELGDVVTVPAGQADGEWDARAFGDDVVFRAGLGAVDRARSGFGPPLSARTCEPSITAFDQSSLSAACSSASSASCRRCHTPAACHSARRRQHVIPDPNPSSCGRNSHGIAVYNTNRIPHSTCRSGSRLRPGCRCRRSTVGSSGSIRSHNPSDTTQGGCSPFLTTNHGIDHPQWIQALDHFVRTS